LGLKLPEARIIYRDTAKAIAAVPATAAPCLATQFADGSQTLSCGSAAGNTASVSFNGAMGLVPDAVKTVTFTMSDGSTATGQVIDNVWKSPGEAAKVTFSLDGHTQQIELMPRSSLPSGATIGADGVVTGGSLQPGVSG
jgi:hypothetical protein